MAATCLPDDAMVLLKLAIYNIDFTQQSTFTFSAFGKTALIITQNVELSKPTGKFYNRPDSFKTVQTV